MKDPKKIFRVLTVLLVSLIAAGVITVAKGHISSSVRADEKTSVSREKEDQIPDGFYKKDGETFYYKDGKKVTGWVEDGDDKYYFYRSSKSGSGNAHTKGAMATGWQNLEGGKYYFFMSGKTSGGNPHKKGAMATGWQFIGDQKFYFRTEGKKKSGKTYPRGTMVTGWQTIDGTKYYFYKTFKTASGKPHRKGAMAKGWQTLSGEKYYFYKNASGSRKSGVMATAGVNISGKGYVFADSGKLLMSNMRGWYKVGEDYYFCDRSTGKMYKNDTAHGIYLRNDGKAQMTDFAKEKIPVMIKSREIVAEITNKSDTLTQKKWKCYKYIAKFPYIYKDAPIGDHIKNKDYACWDAHYANNILNAYGDQKTRGGECSAQSVALGYLFTELNFGQVTFKTSYTHGWIEVNGLSYDALFVKSRGMDWWAMKHYPATPSFTAVI